MPRARGAKERWLLGWFTEQLEARAALLQPDLLHAHSPYYCGLAASRVASRLGVPCVYEVRGLWEETAVLEGRWASGSYDYRRWRDLELTAMQRANAVVAIGRALLSNPDWAAEAEETLSAS